MKILLVKQTSLGDALHSSAALAMLKKNYPNSEVHLVCDVSTATIFRHQNTIDKLFTLDITWSEKNFFKKPIQVLRHFFSLLSTIRKETYDLAVDLQGLSRSAFFVMFAKAKKKALKGTWPFFIPFKTFENRNIHAVEEMKALLVLCGLKYFPENMSFPLSEAAITKAKAWVNENCQAEQKIIISPFSRWENKNWGSDNHIQFINALSSDYSVVLSSSPSDLDALKQIQKSCSRDTIIFQGPIDDYAALISQMDVLISCDSFPMHLGCALDKPVLALFGPTREEKVGPLGKQAKVLRWPNCERCYKRSCKKGCTAKIPPEQVRSQITHFFKKGVFE